MAPPWLIMFWVKPYLLTNIPANLIAYVLKSTIYNTIYNTVYNTIYRPKFDGSLIKREYPCRSDLSLKDQQSGSETRTLNAIEFHGEAKLEH